MEATILPNVDVTPLKELLFDELGRLKILPFSELSKIPHIFIQAFCHKYAIYQIPTLELIEFLKEEIDSRSAIEICAGNGSIGRALDIPRTDSRIQQDPMMAFYYSTINQNITAPPEDVEKFEALAAVDYYKPQVVLGSFITQKYLTRLDTHASVSGVREDIICDRKTTETYIKIGNLNVHGSMRLNKREHEELYFPFLISRCNDQTLNRIFIWNY